MDADRGLYVCVYWPDRVYGRFAAYSDSDFMIICRSAHLGYFTPWSGILSQGTVSLAP